MDENELDAWLEAAYEDREGDFDDHHDTFDDLEYDPDGYGDEDPAPEYEHAF